MKEGIRHLQSTPSLLIGAALLVWGWQCQLLIYAIPMAILVEISPVANWRWAITDKEFNTLSDFSGVMFFLAVLYIFSTEGARGIFVILKFLPFILFPLLITQRYSQAGLMRMSALIVSLRKLKSQDGPERDHKFDIGLPYFVLCLVSASSGNQRTILFFLLVAVLLSIVLWPMRSRRFSIVAWALSLFMAIATGYGLQAGMRHLQASIESSFVGMFDQFMWRYRDPNRATTAIGSLGRLKLSDRIVLRVESRDKLQLPLLLKEASYSSFGHGIWSTKDKDFVVIDQNLDGSWDLVKDKPADRSMRISTYMIKEEGVIPLPHASKRIENVTAIEIARNPHGAVSMDIREGWVAYDVRYHEHEVDEAPPDENDIFLLDYYRQDMEKISSELGLDKMSPAEAVSTVSDFFQQNFSYTLNYRQRYPRGKYLANFLNETRKGHCEYFATATALLLRSVGIPTRYAVGYSVDEYSRLEGQYVARARHAHSWTLVFINGEWQVLDTTPAVWAPYEAEKASAFEPLMDLWSWISYRWELFQSDDVTEEDAQYNWLLWLLIPLSCFLAWRIYFRERVQMQKHRQVSSTVLSRQGEDSEFYSLSSVLEQRFFPRKRGETLSSWLEKLEQQLTLPHLRKIVKLHYRYRFDPGGMPQSEQEELKNLVRLGLEELELTKTVQA